MYYVTFNVNSENGYEKLAVECATANQANDVIDSLGTRAWAKYVRRRTCSKPISRSIMTYKDYLMKYDVEPATLERWYYASYSAVDKDGEEICPDGDYYMADSDEKAIEYAKYLAGQGVDYSDIGHVELDLLQVVRVDPEQEWDEVETVWY
ncbi:MAG: hypothetical protein J6Y37_12100 [Paludibacteraceae bacterium]|nr:hypothetical protein [Paludibacteraceae bacterium]